MEPCTKPMNSHDCHGQKLVLDPRGSEEPKGLVNIQVTSDFHFRKDIYPMFDIVTHAGPLFSGIMIIWRDFQENVTPW